MTMMITKFHRLIQNKFIWFVFSVIVVLSFVVWDMQLPDSDDLANQQSVGEINGEPISPETYQQHRFNTYLAVVQQIGQPVPYQQLQEDLEPMIWQRMVGLDIAADLDMVATDSEIRAGLSQQPAFAENGQFSKARYEAYIRNAIGGSLGIPLTPAGFEAHVREEITLRKLQNMVAQTVLLSPYELKRRYRIYNDIYTADAAIIRPDAVSKDVSTTGDEAKAYFEQDPTQFTIPPKRSIKLFSFPVANFVDPAEVTEEQIQAHYDRNLFNYVAIVTNDVAASATNATENATNELQVAETSIVTNSLEEVQDGIREELAQQSARFKASAAAMDVITDLAPDRSGNAMSLEEAAAKYGLEIQSAGPYAEDDMPTEFGVLGGEVVEQAWLLTTDPNEYFSNPIEDKNSDHVYVIALNEELDSRVPTYDEVKDRVLVAANQQKIADTVVERTKELAEKVENLGGDSTNSLVTLARELGYETQTLDAVNLATGLVNNAYADALVQTLVTLSKGDVSEPVEVQDGYLVVQVRDQQPADDVGFDNYRSQIAPQFTRQITSMVFNDWQEQLLRDGGFSERNFDAGQDEDEIEDVEEEADAGDQA